MVSREVNRYNRIDPAVEARVAELQGRMRLDEKVGQLALESPFAPVDWGAVLGQMQRAEESGQPVKFPREARANFADRLRAGQVGTIMSVEAPVTNQWQRLAVEEPRLGIPWLVGLDVIHGFRTVFPIPLAEASTWNPDLLEQAAQAAAEEASAAERPAIRAWPSGAGSRGRRSCRPGAAAARRRPRRPLATSSRRDMPERDARQYC